MATGQQTTLMTSKIIVFLLRPFARPLRYGALKVMKRFRAPDDRRPIIAASGHLLEEIILPSVFRTFQEEKFRELANFKKLPVAEHDRIFNELEVTGVCLAAFYLRAVEYLVKPKDYHFWRKTEEHLPKQLQRILMGFGVDGSNAKMMRELIRMRREEYEELAKKVWDASHELKPEFRSLPPEMKAFAAQVQAAAVGTTDHIRRGKIREGDPLIRYLVNWLMSLHGNVRKFVRRL